MSDTPVIRVQASQELLNQLLDARTALMRSQRRRPRPGDTVSAELDRLIISVQAARIKAHKEEGLPLQVPRDDPPA